MLATKPTMVARMKYDRMNWCICAGNKKMDKCFFSWGCTIMKKLLFEVQRSAL